MYILTVIVVLTVSGNPISPYFHASIPIAMTTLFDELTCIVCMETIFPPIRTCSNSHNMCNMCSTNVSVHAPRTCWNDECGCHKVVCPMCRVDIKGHKLAYNTLLEMRAKSNTILRISCPNAPACDETMIYEDMMRHVIVCSNKPAPTPVVIQNGANNDDIINNESVSDYTFVYNSLPVYLDDTPMHFPNFFNIGEQIMNILTDSAHLMHALLHFPIPFNIDESVVMESIDLNVDDYIMNILTDSIHVLHNLGLPQMENTYALIRLIHRHGNGRREREPHIISMSIQHNMINEPSSVHSNQTSPSLDYVD
jgi:hypothetical protein